MNKKKIETTESLRIEKIESLTKDKLKTTIVQLLRITNFENIVENENYIIATEKSSFSEIKHVFVIPSIRMSGSIDIDSVAELIETIQSNELANVVTLVSQFHISNGFRSTFETKLNHIKFDYLDRDTLIQYINKYNDSFWRHEDVELLSYEKHFKEQLKNENQLKKLHLSNDKYQKIINLYIQPTLSTNEEEPKTHTYHRKRVDVEGVLKEPLCVFLSGISGSGKTTLLKNIGVKLLENNDNKDGKLNLPIFVTSSDLLEHNRNINNVILSKIKGHLPYDKLHELSDKYNVSVLVDSIDEFEEKDRMEILRVLLNNYTNKGMKFYIGSRGASVEDERLPIKGKIREYNINSFNQEQIKRFVQALLPNEDKANSLMDSLRENKILEKLPITPLTLSLITIIYDEQDYEIPATVTDIYKHFNNIINGRNIVSTKFEFVDISFRERVLSIYGLYLLENPNHEPMNRNEFVSYFKNFFNGKSLTFEYEQIDDVLEYILNNTGILYLKEDNSVRFAHDSYMEFYAAVEIFNYHREKEDDIVSNFFDLMWQNVAIFYGGMTKDMGLFAEKINNKLKGASKFIEYISGIQGAGYLLQALYMTDNEKRKNVILTTLDLVLETNEFFKKMTTINETMLQNYRLPIVQLLNFLHFYEMFNSLTLREPLTMTFEQLRIEYENMLDKDKNSIDTTKLPALGYKLIELAFTLDSKRLNDQRALNYVIEQNELMRDSNLYSLINLCLDFLNKTNYKELRQSVSKSASKIQPLLNVLSDDSTGKIRFSPMDSVHPNRKVKLFVEGKSDALILEHAYMTLTGGCSPYWNIAMATSNGETGSSTEVTNAIETALNYNNDYTFIIGLYDHDAAGLKEFCRLKNDYYEQIEIRCIKQRKDSNIYVICLPIPAEMIQYEQEKQEFNFFEIEHYFGHDYLKQKNMIKEEQTLHNIYEIKDKNKISFANDICKETDPAIFKYFVDLFKKIDQVTGVQVNYFID